MDGGRLLLEQLARDEFEVAVAAWIRTSEDGLFLLYIASPLVDESKPIEAYRKLYSTLNRTSLTSVTPLDVKLLNDQNPIARAAIEVRDRAQRGKDILYQGKRLGDLAIKEACIYPEKPAPRLSFTVTYCRNADSNNWTATLKRGQVTLPMIAKGAISYSTAGREGETKADQKFANIGVLVAIDPKFDSSDVLNHPAIQKMTGDQARMMADRMFKSYHPDAVIEHDEDEEE